LSFGQWLQRDKTAKNYGHYPEVALASPLRLMGETSTFTQDVTHYLTSITVIGERDSLTGKRYLASERLPLAEDAAFADSLYQVGHARHETRRASGLQSDTACLLAARHALGISPLMPDGLAPWFYEGQIAYDPDFRCGDVVRIGGLKFIAESVKFASLAAEEDAQKLNFRAQLAQDVRITP
jgi:hypothetical protein